MSQRANTDESEAILSEDIPVVMPELPTKLVITTISQFKATSDPIRNKILGIIQNQPATAKQIADRLHIAPSTINHHLQVLESAGLARIVARRLIHGIVAKYYTRTARIFVYDFPSEVTGLTGVDLDIITHARDELAEAQLLTAERASEVCCSASFPHARLTPERVQHYQRRIQELVEEFLNEPYTPEGDVYGFCTVFFKSPPYLQSSTTLPQTEKPENDKENKNSLTSANDPS